ncbi:MAG: fructosamine kinase family protein [Piscirickettsiaceae bacterium]|nr:fructosamine kinase family protein [Piscirickettsiaceae bacterium]
MNNNIGSASQCNNIGHNWCNFRKQQRLDKQLQIAHNNGFQGSSQENVQLLS